MKLSKRLKKIKALEEGMEIPWKVMATGIYPELMGSQVRLTKWDNADYVSLEEAQDVVKWLGDQLGLVVLSKDDFEEGLLHEE